MSYTANVPVSGQSLGNSRPIINQNFQTIDTAFTVNHKNFNNAQAGKHELVQLPTAQAASPGTAAGEIALYSKDVAGVPQLFFQKESVAAAGADIQMTVDVVPTAAENGVTFLPGGMILQWGKVATGSVSEIYGFNITFPNNVFNIQVCPISGAAPYPSVLFSAVVSSTALFVIKYSGSTNVSANYPNIYWTAIGN